MHRVPVDEQRTPGEVLARQPQRVGVVPVHGAVVGHQREPHLVGALQRGGPVRDGLPGMPHNDHDLVQARGGQVTQRDVENGGRARHREQSLGQRIGCPA